MGLEGKLKAMLRGAGLGIILVPLAMVAGSLLAGVVYSLLSPMTLQEGLAISAGFGWYTLAPSVISGAGHAVAGAVSFLHNVLRETLGIILLPLAASKIGCIEAVTLPGTCAMDVCLPIVERSWQRRDAALLVHDRHGSLSFLRAARAAHHGRIAPSLHKKTA